MCAAGACKTPNCTTCTSAGNCLTALTNTACGNGGISCIDCTAAGGATCNTATGVCTGGSCASGQCRSASGACVTGNTNGACGTSGSCTSCSSGQVCTNGQCMTGGAGGGSGAGGGMGSGTCPGGAPCSTGCCSGQQCIALSFQSAMNCGTSAATCATCSTGQLCTAGVCGGTGGGSGSGGGTGGAGAGGAGGAGGGGTTAGVLGAACVNDTDCGGIVVSMLDQADGYKPFCKKTMNPTGHAYPGGMCTRRCVAGSMCGTGNTCDFADGPFGEIDNICLPGCSMAVPCRPGFKCYDYGTNDACYPFFPDGGNIGPFDPGPGNSDGGAAQPCTDSTQCAPQTPPPALGFCFLPTTADGGPSAFVGGQCSAQCNTALIDAWCGENGACNGFIGPTTSTGPSVVFICQQECTRADAGVRSTCRTGYACNAPVNGVCSPRCDNPGAGCVAPRVCNTTTGLCG